MVYGNVILVVLKFCYLASGLDYSLFYITYGLFEQIAKILLHNAKVWRGRWGTSPILVVCYTNHALDQFLEEIHTFHKQGIVRVGGRSQSKAMQECSLSKWKSKTEVFKITEYLRECPSDIKSYARDFKQKPQPNIFKCRIP